MPSHKHKKKKKSHKKCKRKDMSSSDDEGNFWMLSLSDSDNDESQGGEILTSLVRRSYINHLQQVLIENFMTGTGPTDLCKNSVQELASKWASVLEKKALRASMLSEMYRRSMVSSIKAIQARTCERRIYVDEKMLSRIKFILSKETQTDDYFGNRCNAEIQTDCPQVCAAETQTDQSVSSLLELPLPKTLSLSPPSRPYDPAINFSDSCPSSPGVSSSQPQLIPTIITSDHQDVCSITSTSDLMPAPGPVPVVHNDTVLSEHRLSTDTRTTEISRPIDNVDNHIKATSTTCGTNIKMNHLRQKGTNNSNPDYNEDNSNSFNVKGDLNARLNAMGLLNDADTEMDIAKSKKSNWYSEEVAQSCNLTRILLRMTARQRERVLKKFKKLFGDENELLSELSEENIRICRKRIASVVVMELTPLYQAKRIASRHLFKYVAKKITKTLMDRSYAPDSRCIRQKVKEFFKNGHVVMSEADCT